MRRALLVGASRGLGLALGARFLDRGWDVTATVRRPSPALGDLAGRGTLRIKPEIDIDDKAAIADLRERLAGTSDIVFVVAGVWTSAEAPAADRRRRVRRQR